MARAVSIPKAVEAYGGSRALARRIKRPFQTVHGWGRPGRRVVPLAQILISAAANEDKIDVWVDKPKRGVRRKK